MGRTVLGKMVKGDLFREVAFVETPEMEGSGTGCHDLCFLKVEL